MLQPQGWWRTSGSWAGSRCTKEGGNLLPVPYLAAVAPDSPEVMGGHSHSCPTPAGVLGSDWGPGLSQRQWQQHAVSSYQPHLPACFPSPTGVPCWWEAGPGRRNLCYTAVPSWVQPSTQLLLVAWGGSGSEAFSMSVSGGGSDSTQVLSSRACSWPVGDTCREGAGREQVLEEGTCVLLPLSHAAAVQGGNVNTP